MLFQEQCRLNIEIIQSDFSTVPLGSFSFVVVYLGRHGNCAVREKIMRECSSGTTVMSVGVSSNDGKGRCIFF